MMVDVEEDNQGGEEDQSGEEETMVDVEEDNQGDEEDQSGEGAAEGSGGRRRRKKNRRNKKNKKNKQKATTSGQNDGKLWKVFSPRGKVCDKGPAFHKGKRRVKSQMDCQKIAISKGHTYYQYRPAFHKGKRRVKSQMD